MKGLLFLLSIFLLSFELSAQCSICTKTAQQMGESAAEGLNGGILYLAAAPFLLIAFIGYKWWKHTHGEDQ